MKGTRFTWMTAGTMLACILSMIFAAFTIVSTSKLAEQTSMVYEHPYQVRTATEAMRTRLSEMELYLPTLLISDEEHAEEIKKLLRERDERQDASLAIIEECYLGPEEDVMDLKQALAKVRAARIEAAEHFTGTGDSSEILDYLDEYVNPYGLAVDEVLARIAFYADYRIGIYMENTIQIKNLGVIGSLTLGVVMIIMLILTNMSEARKNREIAYREQLFDLLSSNIEDTFFIYDCVASKMEYVSKNSERVIGMRGEVFLKDALALRENISEDTREVFDEFFRNKPIPNNAQCEFNYVKDGIVRNMQLQMYAVYSGKRLQRYIAVLTDLTRIMEHQNILNDALLSAQKANMAKREFLSRMSHEIRTPMNTIIGMTAIAMRHMDDISYIENCLTKITYSSGHLLSLINDILDMSKIEDNKLTINHEIFDVQRQLESISAVVYPQTVERKQNFEVVINSLVEERLIGDALRVNQILFNLLSNAVKFTPAGGNIRLEITKVREKKNHVFLRFVVRDSGIGMSEEYLERIYTPFEQADVSIAQKYGGSGLGMSISKNLISLLNGTITVQSKEGEGTTFTVEIPFEKTEQQAQVNQEEFDNMKVLVVDDDESTCEHAALLLDSLGVKSSWVNNGREAVEIVVKAHEVGEDYDVCFIDWCMPDMDGVETARNIRKHIGPEALIIIISAYDWSVIEAKAREAGVNAFISKPMFASSIYNVLNSMIRPKGMPLDGKQSQDVQYDFKGRKVLLAEDNLINQEVVVELLKDIGIVVECADNGKLALDMYEQSEPDEYALILMDVQMPIMNGYETTRAIRKSNHLQAKSVPILAMTANAFNEDVAAAKESGMNGHLSKPIDVNILYETLASYLRK